MISLGINSRIRIVTSGTDPDAQAYFDRAVDSISDTDKGYINTLISGIKGDNGLTDLTDGIAQLLIFAQSGANNSLLDITANAFNATDVNSTTFTAYEGRAGNGTTSYINTGRNPSSGLSLLSLNDFGMFVYCRTNSAESSNAAGCHGAAATHFLQLVPRYSDGNHYGRVNQESAGVLSVAGSDSRGMFSVERTASNAQKLKRNGSTIVSNATVSSALPNANAYVCARNAGGTADSYSSRQYAVFGFYKPSVVNEANLYTRIQNYMTSVGTAV